MQISDLGSSDNEESGDLIRSKVGASLVEIRDALLSGSSDSSQVSSDSPPESNDSPPVASDSPPGGAIAMNWLDNSDEDDCDHGRERKATHSEAKPCKISKTRKSQQKTKQTDPRKF